MTHRRARGRGWWHRGEHHRRRGALSVEDIRQSLNPPGPRQPPGPGEAVYLGQVTSMVHLYGSGRHEVTLGFSPQEGPVTVPTLADLAWPHLSPDALGPETVTMEFSTPPLYAELPTEPLAIQAAAQ